MPNFDIKFDYLAMRQLALREEEWFEQFGQVTHTSNGLSYVYQDNNSPRLLVAHLDSVASHQNRFFRTTNEACDPIVCTPTLDDRLGVYIILKLLKDHYGNDYDILLTRGEESGQSTAKDFMLSDFAKQRGASNYYNWIAEFDRMGRNDCALYDFRDAATDALVRRFGWTPVDGSYTDIRSMQDLNCKGFNISVGYEDYHNKNAWANLTHTAENVARFMMFYDLYRDVRLPHTRKVYQYNQGYSRYSGAWNDEDWYNEGQASRGGIHRLPSSTSATNVNNSTRFYNPHVAAGNFVSDDQFAWMDEKNTQVFPIKGKYIAYEGYIHPTTKQVATFCTQCNVAHYMEQLTFPDGIPMCAACFSGVETINEFQTQWLDEGGLLITDLSKDKERVFIRAVTEVMEKETVQCFVCGEPDFHNKATVMEDNGQIYHICRPCVEEAASFNKRLDNLEKKADDTLSDLLNNDSEGYDG